jgi:hypothetical protein
MPQEPEMEKPPQPVIDEEILYLEPGVEHMIEFRKWQKHKDLEQVGRDVFCCCAGILIGFGLAMLILR